MEKDLEYAAWYRPSPMRALEVNLHLMQIRLKVSDRACAMQRKSPAIRAGLSS
jgi:hypothetical protein